MAYTTIDKSSLHFNTKLYTGNGGTNAITGVGFQPDMVWTKNRSSAQNHLLYDVVRGVGYYLYPNLTNAQGGSGSPSTTLVSFDSDGFTLGSGDDSNVNGQNGVGWSWKAGGGQGSSNTDGSTNTTYTSANTTAGFSIVSWTGTGSATTLGHGLNAVPKMIIAKRRSATRNWPVYHHTLGNDKKMYLNDTQASSSSTNWNSTTPTSSVFSIGSADDINGNGSTYVAYVFAEKPGYSKFGSYVGNGSSDGAFIYTGFRPAWIMAKNSDAADHWVILDTKRGSYNQVINPLFPNLNNAESSSTSYAVDILSNGFKFRGTDGATNSSGNVYIYMAFAEAPLVGSNNIPATAR